MNIELIALSDEELVELESQADKRGRTSVYPECVRNMLAQSNGDNVSGRIDWNEVNADAAESKSVKTGEKSPRDIVIAGLKNAVKSNKKANGRVFFVRPSDDENAITVVVRKSA